MKKLICFTIAVSAIYTLSAQTNFSGTWKRSALQHVSGPEYTNAMATALTLSQTKDSLITETSSTGADGQETKTRGVVSLDGKPLTTTSATSGRKIVRNAGWSADKKILTLTSNIYKEGDASEIELTRIDTWSLSPDGKQLFITRKSVETVSENWEVKATFDKQ